ncbi:MAG: non-homologous end-joining DNA ligase [Bacillota bacterium]
MATKPTLVEIEGKTLQLTNLDKVLWPEDGYTKGDMIRYYTEMAAVMIPHYQQRPLVLTRYPNGIHGKWFYQKNIPEGTPEWVHTHSVGHKEREIAYVIADNLPTFAWLANQGCIEMHPWLSRIGSLPLPDVVVIDLDPAEGATYEHVREVAFLVKRILDEFGLISFPKTSGSTGLHIYVPIDNVYSYYTVGEFVRYIGDLLVKVYPERVTNERLVKNRDGKVYVDYLQNREGKTLAGVYSIRPHPGAPVSTPITWSEAETVYPRDFTIKTVPERVRSLGDLFSPTLQIKQTLPQAWPRGETTAKH